MLYQELQPVDTFKIKMASPFSDYDRQLLTLFYQPLIGPQAMSLFMSFWADAECEKETEYNHYYLMNLLTMPLGQVFEARISLEAIGLLRTYCKQEEHDRVFIYELLPPMDAKSFFDDPLLSTFLFSKIGEQAYRGLRNRFLEDHSLDDSYKEVSRTFLDVYKPIRFAASERMDETTGEMRGRNESTGIPFAYSDFDFNLLRAGLSEQMVPKASLASVSKELIEKLAFLYSLTPIDMQKVVMMALDENLKLPEERLRKSAVDYYKMNISQNVPMIEKAFKKEEPVKVQELATREDELLFYLESTSPREMLRDLNGREPFPVDIQLAERLINTHGLSIGVVNVLLQYMILRNDGKITNNFAERIASHWSNKKVASAKVAMELSRTEHDQYMKWLNEGKQKPAGRKPTREEKVPEWFYKKEGTEKREQETNTDPAIDEKRRQLMEKLDAMRTGVK